jgi:outer membrane protein OmpA-like peptidoglycan-associated protein
MSFNLLDAVQGAFTPNLVSQAASLFGENESGMTKALSAGVPAILSGILSNAQSDNGANVLNLAKQAAGSGILDNLGGLFSGGSNSSTMNMGASLLSGLLGSRSNPLVSMISSFAGVKSSSTNSLLSAIAPIALSYVGKQALSGNLSGNSLLSWLGGQKESITKAVPAGLNFSSIFEGDTKKVVETVRDQFEEPKRKTNWFLPLLLGLLALALFWYLMKGCNKEEVVNPAPTADSIVAPTVTEPVVPVAPVRESFKVKLPDGSELDAWKGGIEDRLVTCLNDAACQVGKDVWFDFDDLNFETGSANITAESQKQINNIAAILKAYPKVKIKIGGYTDRVGDPAANKKLSQERADATAAAIKKAGGNGAQISGAEGYGSELATVAADASDEERKKDRRISISVREK